MYRTVHRLAIAVEDIFDDFSGVHGVGEGLTHAFVREFGVGGVGVNKKIGQCGR